MKRLLILLVLLLPFSFAQERVVSLNGDITEIVFGLGLESHLAAVDVTSNYPSAALDLPNVGYHGALNAEALLAYEPDLVIAGDAAGPAEVFEQLEAVGVRVEFLPEIAGIDTPANNIRFVAELFGEVEAGEALVAQVQDKIAQAGDLAGTLAEQPRILFLYLGSTQMQFAGGAGAASNAIIEAVGAIDVGAEAGLQGFSPFGAELVVAGAPDVIIVTDRGLSAVGGLEGVLEVPGVAQTPAGQNGHIISFEDGYLINLGLRTGDALIELAEYLLEVQ